MIIPMTSMMFEFHAIWRWYHIYQDDNGQSVGGNLDDVMIIMMMTMMMMMMMQYISIIPTEGKLRALCNGTPGAKHASLPIIIWIISIIIMIMILMMMISPACYQT